MPLWLAKRSAFHPHVILSAFAIDSWVPPNACRKPKSLLYVPSDLMAAGGGSLLISADPETPVGNFPSGFFFFSFYPEYNFRPRWLSFPLHFNIYIWVCLYMYISELARMRMCFSLLLLLFFFHHVSDGYKIEKIRCAVIAFNSDKEMYGGWILLFYQPTPIRANGSIWFESVRYILNSFK